VELKVEVSTNVFEGFELDHTITGFDDAEKIGQRVGRAVRDWLRSVPISKNGRRMRIEVDATWQEAGRVKIAEEKPKRKRKKGADNGARS